MQLNVIIRGVRVFLSGGGKGGTQGLVSHSPPSEVSPPPLIFPPAMVLVPPFKFFSAARALIIS